MWIQIWIRTAIIIVILVSVLYLPILFILKKKGVGILRQLSFFGLILSALLVIFATSVVFNYITFSPEHYYLNLVPFQRFTHEVNPFKTIVTEMIPNLLIFVPLGTFIPIVYKQKRKLTKLIPVIFLITFCIEFFQYFIGRTSDIDDIIMNLSGGIMGYGLYRLFHALFKGKKWWGMFVGSDLESNP